MKPKSFLTSLPIHLRFLELGHYPKIRFDDVFPSLPTPDSSPLFLLDPEPVAYPHCSPQTGGVFQPHANSLN